MVYKRRVKKALGRRSRRAVTRSAGARLEEALFVRVVGIVDAARGHVARSVNTAMVQAYWLIGREIIDVEQRGARRAGYGDEVIERLAKRLAGRLGQGFGARTLRRIRQFYLAYADGSALSRELGGPRPWSVSLAGAKRGQIRTAPLSKSKPDKIRTAPLSKSKAGQIRTAPLSKSKPDKIRTAPLSKSKAGHIRTAPLSKSGQLVPAVFPSQLGWTHYLVLLRVADPTARAFYEIEAVREGWSSRELERQIASLLFERLARSRNKEKVLALARKGQRLDGPSDVLKEPFVLEFLELGERSVWRERELEQAIIDRIESFLLELGKGFCFVARQKRMTIDGDHFYADLVFYNRLLRAFILVDLKLGKLTHQDLGQMQMYVSYFDQFQRAEHEARTIGIVLCSEKNDAMAKITLPDSEQIRAVRYQMYLPTEAELRAELARERDAAEQALRLAADERAPRPRAISARASGTAAPRSRPARRAPRPSRRSRVGGPAPRRRP
jgi:predicted nuclease of restriction endonuclease-like (RecB) superfamily